MLEPIRHPDRSPLATARPSSTGRAHPGWPSGERQNANRPGHDRRYAIDCSKITAALGWKPAESFETGLRKTVAAFPNARYLTQRGELMPAREQNPRDAVSYRAPNYEPLLDSGQLHLLDGDAEISPTIRVQVTPGHNRDMMVVMVRSGGATWCHLADLAPYAAHVTPTLVAAFDLFPLESIASKNDLFARAAAEGWWCSFAHDPSVAFAKIGLEDGKWRIEHARS